MKKIISLLLMMMLTVGLLAACTEQQGTPPPSDGKYTGPIYSSDLAARIVTSATAPDYEIAAYNSISSAILSASGKMPTHVTDASECTKPEIVIGKTNRDASNAAYKLLYSGSVDPESGICYKIYYNDGVLAIAAENERAMTLATEYAISLLFSTSTLSLKDGYTTGYAMTLEDYENMLMADVLEAELEKYENRWSTLIAEGATADVIDAFKRLFDFYGEDVIDWFANLWESSICCCGNCDSDAIACYGGGFYYANSARDYENFLPDLESTRQALVFVRGTGMISYYGDDLDKAIPEWMQDRIMAFVNACGDPDGYYYHPQWGKSIGTSRRGRDLDWAIDLAKIFGFSLKYPTALDQMAGATSSVLTSPLTSSAAKAVSAVVATASANDCLDSAENMIAWLNTMNFKANSHDNGHAVASLTSQIKAKGLDKVVYDYFVNLMEEVQEELRDEAEAAARKNNPSITATEIAEARKNAENGLWQKEINYVSLSGLYKIGGMINTFGYDLPHEYAMAAVRSAVKAITLTDEPTILVHVFNNWAGLNTQLSNMRSANKRALARGESEIHDMEAAYNVVRAEAPSLIEATINKLALFRKPDGSYSYYQKNSAPTTQGVPVSMGFAEGDVNASMIALSSISNFIFNTMNYTRVPMYHLGHFIDFLDTVEGLTPVEKIPFEKDVSFTFDDDTELPMLITPTLSAGELQVIADPTSQNRGNVLSFISYASVADTFTIRQPSNAPGMTSFAIEADYCIQKTQSVDNIDDYQFTVKASDGNVYMYTFAYSSGDTVTIGDASSTGSGNKNVYATVKKGEWFNLRIECYQLEDSTVAFKIIVNGKTVGISRNYFGSEVAGSQPRFGLVGVLVRALMRTDATLLIDNLKIETFNNIPFTEN